MEQNLNKTFIGREFEVERLKQLGQSSESSIVVVHGRRRVGKTTLIEHVYSKRNLWKFEGVENQDKKYQIKSFLKFLAKYSGNKLYEELSFTSWREPLLKLAELVSSGVHTIFFEELQWLACYKDDFIAELKLVWDNYLSKNNKLVLVLCGSSPSFMLSKVLRSKALYNRSINEIALLPLSLEEIHQYLGKNYPKGMALEAALMVDGIPEYLKYLKRDSSPYLSFCKHAFTPGGFFLDEINRILVSSLSSNHVYRETIHLLGQKGDLSRPQIGQKLGISSGSNLSRVLQELELSGLISPITSYNKSEMTKLKRYEIKDRYLRLYFRFINPILKQIKNGSYKSNPTQPLPLSDLMQALGYSFENYCRENVSLIANILGFGAVDFRAGSLLARGKKGGIQLDLVFDRADRVLTVCEIKYQSLPVDVGVAKTFKRKLSVLNLTPRQRLHTVLIAPFGVTQGLINEQVFDRVIDLNDLFRCEA